MNWMKRLAFLLLTFWFPARALYAETQDSTLTKSNFQQDSAKLETLNHLVHDLTYSNTDQALVYAFEMRDYAKSVNEFDYLAKAEKSIGNAFFIKGKYAYSLEHYLVALDLIQDHQLGEQIAGILHNIGSIHVRWQHPERALHYFEQARIKNIENQNYPWLVYNLMGIGIVYSDLLKDNATAILHHQEALDLALEKDDKQGILISLINLGTCYLNISDFQQAEHFLNQADEFHMQHNYRVNLDRLYEKLGLVAFHKGNYQKAESYFILSLEEQNLNGSKDYLAEWHVNFAKLKAALGNHEMAFEHMKIAQAIKDSIFGFREKNQLADLEAQFELATAKKETELAKKDTIISRQEQHRSDVLRRIWVGVAVGLFILLMLIYSAFRINRKNLELLATKSDDLTKVNNELARVNHQLEDLIAEKNNILHVVAHDLRTPLAKIGALSDLLKLDTELSPKQKERLEKIDMAVAESSIMMHELLDAQKDNFLHKEVQFEAFDPDKVVRDFIFHYQPNAKLKKLKLKVDSNPTTLKSDKHRFGRILDNLLSNAIKFSPEGKTIWVGCEESGDTHFKLTIRDEGPGFSEADKRDAFQTFQPLSAKPIGEGSSHGLGLSIVKRMVDEVGGEIVLHSKFGEGAHFEILFPAVELD
jgi:signal transduction histidine kinase